MENAGQGQPPNPEPDVTPAEKHQLEVDKLAFEKRKHEFEILQAFHSAGLERWKDRRENEWKLNYAIWAAIAGLDALLLHDGSNIPVTPRQLWWIGAGCLILHMTYLWPTISRAISEIQLQSDAEHAMLLLLTGSSVKREIKEHHLGGRIRLGEKPNKWPKPLRLLGASVWKHYGLIAPLLFTIALLMFGGYLVNGHARGADKHDDNGTVIYNLNAPPPH